MLIPVLDTGGGLTSCLTTALTALADTLFDTDELQCSQQLSVISDLLREISERDQIF